MYALSIHSDYRCQHSGICCHSDWDVPVEAPVYATLVEALGAGRLHATGEPADGDPLLITEDDLPDGAAAIIAQSADGRCIFHHADSRRCVVHRDLGEPTLPSTCRHFPRLAVRDGRGTFISLTHYCPTAAAMLFRDDVPTEIVEGPAAFPLADYEGLDVEVDAWPPLLHPKMLLGLEDYSAWERHMVSRCAVLTVSPESVVATLERDARGLRRFTPDGPAFTALVESLPAEFAEGVPPVALDPSLRLYREVMTAVPDDLRPAADEAGLAEPYKRAVSPHWAVWHAPLNRYLAAKAFANWTAYQGRGLLSIVRGLEAALAVVRVEAARGCRDLATALTEDVLREAFRRADFILNHLAVGEDLADSWSRVEKMRSSKTAATGA